MQFTVEAEVLSKALARLTGIVERRTTIPILSMVMIEASGSTLALTTTDMERRARTTIPAEVAVAGRTCVDAHTLADIARKLRTDMTIKLGKDRIDIKAGTARFALPTLLPEDYPNWPEGREQRTAELAGDVLLGAIGRCRAAVSTEETRYYLNGVYFHTDAKRLKAVATDGHRLACIDVGEAGPLNGMAGAIVPRKTVDVLSKLLAGCTVPVRVEIGETKVQFTIGDTVLASKLIDGTFPDYKRVIPQPTAFVEVEVDPLAQAIDRVATIASDRGRAMRLKFGDGVVSLDASDPQGAMASETVEIDGSSEIVIGFNAGYLLEIAGVVGDRVRIGLIDPGSPALMQPVVDGAIGVDMHVLMPMKVG